MNEYEVQVFVPYWGDGVGGTLAGEGYWNTVNRFQHEVSALDHKALLSEYYVRVRVIQKAHVIVEERIVE